jgi:hypothetical protein
VRCTKCMHQGLGRPGVTVAWMGSRLSRVRRRHGKSLPCDSRDAGAWFRTRGRAHGAADPIRRGHRSPGQSDAARQSAFDRGVDQGRRKEHKRDSHVDMSRAAVLADCDFCDTVDDAAFDLRESQPATRDRRDKPGNPLGSAGSQPLWFGRARLDRRGSTFALIATRGAAVRSRKFRWRSWHRRGVTRAASVMDEFRRSLPRHEPAGTNSLISSEGRRRDGAVRQRCGPGTPIELRQAIHGDSRPGSKLQTEA